VPQKTQAPPKRAIFSEQCNDIAAILTTIRTHGRNDLAPRMVKQFTNAVKGLEKIAEWARLNPGTYEQIVDKATATETPVKTRAARA